MLSAPAALSRPNRTRIGRFTWPRKRQQRTAVAAACGNVTSATAVVVPNLYYRSGAYAPFDPRQVAAEGPERDRFKSMIRSITDTMVMRDTAAVITWIDSFPAVRPGRIGVRRHR